MMTEIESKVIVKLFVGVSVTPELKMHLDSSGAWKLALIGSGDNADELIATHFEKREYIGAFTEGDNVTLGELRALTPDIKAKIGKYCPDFNLDRLTITVFPQVFLS